MANRLLLIASLSLFACACKQPPRVQENLVPVDVPQFNADSAFNYTARQVEFGPRVPNTAAHKACGAYLADCLRSFGAEVTEQETTLRLKDNTPIEIKNIIGSFQPEKRIRIMLCAHWDSRPFADNAPNEADRLKPIDGANDGAGAAAVLLEIARQIGQKQPAAGVDIILFDAEDWGEPRFAMPSKHYGTFCMGSEYWAKNPHVPNYKAKFGILLDMVGAPNAAFYRDYYSMQFAPQIVKKVWEAANSLGYSDYFINKDGGGIQDDHYYVNEYRKIPCIDIIHYDTNRYADGFADYWHTHNDNMKNVDTATLKVVGQTLMYVIYNEK
ncbi:MAG: M28 family peptidase [Dysgonamonadaceae bacterium]|nr:M28 family peptidase [Dysgonamonadaceae bacterium]